MALTRLSSSSSADPLWQLGRLLADLLPHEGLPLLDRFRRWSDRMLVLCVILMCWAGGSTLLDRFGLARSCLVELYPARKRPGVGYNGFIDCLSRHSARLLKILITTLRKRLIEVAGPDWRTHGFVVFGCDGTKISLPRSDANLEYFKLANKKHAGPEMLLCGLFHLSTRSLFGFAHGIATASERTLLALMLPCLPKDSLLIADAGFVGYQTMKALIDAGHHFIIRAGANVRLLRNLGYVKEQDGIVYLWPKKQQKAGSRPLVLRRVMVRDERGRQMCLLVSVLEESRLDQAQILRFYKMRWHVEVSYRWLKQTMQGRKCLSSSPGHAKLELDWTMISLWVLTLLSLAQGVTGRQLCMAGTLRVVREAMTQRRTHDGQPLALRLWEVRKDDYRRTRSKSKRHYPRRSRLHRRGVPQARMASDGEVLRCKALIATAA
jgi:hypothetical protein